MTYVRGVSYPFIILRSVEVYPHGSIDLRPLKQERIPYVPWINEETGAQPVLVEIRVQNLVRTEKGPFVDLNGELWDQQARPGRVELVEAEPWVAQHDPTAIVGLTDARHYLEDLMHAIWVFNPGTPPSEMPLERAIKKSRDRHQMLCELWSEVVLAVESKTGRKFVHAPTRHQGQEIPGYFGVWYEGDEERNQFA